MDGSGDKSKRRAGAKKLVVLALFVALSLVVFVVENQLPPLFVPGAKLGLANIFSLAALVLYGPLEAVAVVLARTLLGSLITGTVSALVYSLAAGLTAVAVSSLLVCLCLKRVSLLAASVASAVVHNLTQNLLFVLLNGAPEMLAYLPYLALIGLPSGALVGAVVTLLIKKLPEKTLLSVTDGG